MAETQALEKPAGNTAVITTPTEFVAALSRWQEKHFNVLTPFTNISGLAPAHAIYSSLVQISLDKSQQEVYSDVPWLKKGEVALAKRGLRKIAEGLGISTELEYISVEPDFWHVKAIAKYTGIDGMPIRREASEVWDLREGSARTRGWKPDQVWEGKKHGIRNCETRAINAAIRECGTGIKQSYTPEELARPFVAVRVAVQPNMEDPEQARMVLAAKLGATQTLYPQRGLPAPPVDAFADDEPQHVGSGSTANAQETKAEDQPPTVDAVRIVKAEPKEFTISSGAKKGQKGVRYLIVDSTGLESSTFDKHIFELAQKCAAEKTWVELTTETNGQYTNLLEITVAGTAPKLPGLDRL